MDEFLDRDFFIINNIVNEFCNALRIRKNDEVFYSRDVLSRILRKIEILVQNEKFYKEWGCCDETQSVEFSRDEIKVCINALGKIFSYLDDDDIDTRVGYSPEEIKAVKKKLEGLI